MDYTLIAPRNNNISAIEQVLKNRGIKDAWHYLNTSDFDILSPDSIANIEAGVKMLISHIAQGDKILVQVDSDCDGYTSAAVLINYLNCLFPSFVQNNICYRTHEGKEHGLNFESIPENVKLVIAPDASSSDYEVHEQLYNQGIDVLVIDHHEAEKISPYACVINNQLCDYPTKSLSGVGMVYKFCSYLDSILGVSFADNYLDLVSLGLVADMMDLRDYETRHLVDKGLKRISNPYFLAMTIKNEYSLGDTITPFGIAFYIAPYINAITRSGTNEEKLLIFESMIEFLAYQKIPSTKRGHKPGELETRVEQACRTSVNVKNRQTKNRDSDLELIQQIIEDENLLNDKVISVITQKTSLAGLIANQLMSIYQKPVLILSEVEKEDGIYYEGSCRGPNVPGFEDCKAVYEASGLTEYAQGHANAFGISIKKENYTKFIDYVNTTLVNFDFSPHYKVDFVYDVKDEEKIYYDCSSLMEFSRLWGQEVDEPLIVIKNIPITTSNITLMKGTTLKIVLSDNQELSIIKFKSNQEEFETLKPKDDYGKKVINVIGTCKKNTWNQQPQLIITDYEIINSVEYYF